MGHDGGKIDLRLSASANAEVPRRAQGMGNLSRCDQRLGGDAAIVQAVAAHLALFEKDGLETQLRRTGGDGQPARPGTNNDDVSMDGSAHTASPDLRNRRSTTGNSDNRPRPTKGKRTCGSKITRRFGSCPEAKTSPSPAPRPE